MNFTMDSLSFPNPSITHTPTTRYFMCVRIDLRHTTKLTNGLYPTVTGVLKGYDALMNLVLDEVQEDLRGKFVPC